MEARCFNEGEGDAYHQRNRAKALDPHPSEDIALKLLAAHNVLWPGQRILDVGCGYPWRLWALHAITGGECYGVDASAEAIAEGHARWPELHLWQGPATYLCGHGEFDGILIHYLMHWLDRELLLGFVAEIDRVLKDGGWLAICDFDPDMPTRIPYHHRVGLWTYKLPQAGKKLWLSTGLYHELGRVVFDHDYPFDSPQVPSERRAACVLLRKESQYKCT